MEPLNSQAMQMAFNTSLGKALATRRRTAANHLTPEPSATNLDAVSALAVVHALLAVYVPHWERMAVVSQGGHCPSLVVARTLKGVELDAIATGRGPTL